MIVERQFGQNLVRLRKRKGMSQEDLGFASSLHRTEIGMLERGVRLARIDTLLKLCGALGVTPNELLDGLEWTPGARPLGQFGTSDEGES